MRYDRGVRRLFSMLVLFVLVGSSGCVQLKGLRQPSHEIRYFTLDYPPPLPSHDAAPVGVIRLRRLTSAALYTTDRLIVQVDDVSTESPYYDRWAVNPSTMITDLLLRDLTASGLFRAVVTNPAGITPDYEMAGNLETLRASRRDSGWEAEVTLSLLLYPYSDEGSPPGRSEASALLQKRYTVQKPCADRESATVVETLNRCMEELSRELRTDLAAFVRAHAASGGEGRRGEN